jgi:general secretion pathway protein K
VVGGPWADKRGSRTGSALLTVLWLTAALAVIAFSLANTVRGELERTSTEVDGVRAYYLAAGAIDRALLYMLWGPHYPLPEGGSLYYTRGMPFLRLAFPTGEALVQVVPEAGKLNVNRATPEDLFRLLVNLGVEPDRAREVVMGILDWRTPTPPDASSPFDPFYLSRTPSFRGRHASFQEIEEVLLVKGMTPELFYGTYERDSQGRLVPRTGLRDCVSIYGGTDRFDVNTAPPALLASAGLSPDMIAAIVADRQARPFRSMDDLDFIPPDLRSHLGVNTGVAMYTVRATARLRLSNGQFSDLRRSVAAQVKFLAAGKPQPWQILRWYDNEWVQ